MARPSLYDPAKAGNRMYSGSSNPKFIGGDHLDNATLQAGEWITIWSDMVAADTVEFWGFGPRNRKAANASFAYCELVASGNGDGAAGDNIDKGQLRFAIVDSTGDDVRRRTYGDLGDLTDAQSDSRTERPMNAELQPGASEDKKLELQVPCFAAG